jgi:transcriptional regulator
MSHDDDREWKKGSAELLILALLDDRARHGYEIAKLIDTRSGGTLHFRVTSLYPLLYSLEERGVVEGRWVERAGQRRRRYYRLTQAGRTLLDRQRRSWKSFVGAVGRVTGIDYA